MIKTKSIRDPVDASDAKRILVMRLWPRHYLKEKLCLTQWQPHLAPSKELLQDWHAGNIRWEQYATRYLNEMDNRREAIAELAKTAEAETITLLCIEDEDNPHCHRHLLKKLIEQAMQNQ